MTTEEFEKCCLNIVNGVRLTSPYDTGNLRRDGIRYEFVDTNTFKIFVDEEKAPYMVFTNEKWISPKWNGKQNPNEKWWDNKAVDAVINGLINELGDKFEKVELK